MNEDRKVIDANRKAKAWLIGGVVYLELFYLGHLALVAIGLDAYKLCCVFYGLVVWCHFFIALLAIMFGIIAGREDVRRPYLEES